MKPGSEEPYWKMFDTERLDYHIVSVPKQTWKLEISPDFFIYVNENQKVPNWFYRKMARALLGWKWTKL